MNINFLGQGFEPVSTDAVGNHIIRYLQTEHFTSFTVFSAFTTEAGIFGLSEHIQNAKKYMPNISIITGIDQHGTSKEALEEILLLDVNSFIFFQRESPIFHPKLYLFEGPKEIKLIVGSSNLTSTGLFTNVESSLLVEFEVGDEQGHDLLVKVKTYYKSLFEFSDPNLKKLSKAVISDFYAEGIVPDEETRQKNYFKAGARPLGISTTEGFEVAKRDSAKIPTTFKRKKRKPVPERLSPKDLAKPKTRPLAPLIVSQSPAVTIPELVWQSGPLSERDLNIPTGSNTNPTGSMLFKKGLTKDIDQRHYFRDYVFAALPWAGDPSPTWSHLERATAFFTFEILGEKPQTFPLQLTHNTKTDSKSYLQNNSMTGVSWGNAKRLVARKQLIGKSASLFRFKDKSNEFLLVIK